MVAPDAGIPFPTIELRAEDGRPAPAAGAEAVYAFFHTGCPTCELSWPYLERLRGASEGGALRVLAVSQDGPRETRAFNRRLGVRVETLYDPPPWRASEALRLASVPVFLRVSPEGRLREVVVGFQREKMEELAARAAALAGRDPRPLFLPGESVPAARPG